MLENLCKWHFIINVRKRSSLGCEVKTILWRCLFTYEVSVNEIFIICLSCNNSSMEWWILKFVVIKIKKKKENLENIHAYMSQIYTSGYPYLGYITVFLLKKNELFLWKCYICLLFNYFRLTYRGHPILGGGNGTVIKKKTPFVTYFNIASQLTAV